MRRNQGFTFIELLIVVAIIVIIAARAIPNLLDANMRANESNTANALGKYVEAQQAFRTRYGDYAADFTQLRHRPAEDGEKTLDLIDKDFARAKAPDGTPFHGYLFTEPVRVGTDARSGKVADSPDSFWASRFALLAVPAISGRTGSRAFFIDNDGVLLMKDLPAEKKAADSIDIDTPLDSAEGWLAR